MMPLVKLGGQPGVHAALEYATIGVRTMTLSELQTQVALGEDSSRQFKQDMQSPDALAAEVGMNCRAL